MLLAAGFSLSAQKLYRLQMAEDSFSFTVKAGNGRLVLEPAGETALFQPKKDFPVITAVRLEEADLILDYQPGKSKDALSYNITLRLRRPDGQTVEPQTYELSDQAAPAAGGRRIIWLDATEQTGDFSGAFTLLVRRSLMGAVNCEGLRPEFTLKKKMPFYAAGAAAAALVGLGEVYRAQRNDYYETYQRLWREGESAPGANDDPLHKARDKGKAANICTWAGAGLLAADALLFGYTHLKIRGKQRVYDKFCGEGTSLLLQPSFGLPEGLATGQPAPGIHLTFSF